MVRVIAIDGPAASGKSTTAAAVARALGGGDGRISIPGLCIEP